MWYENKIITTEDPQLDGLNVRLKIESYEQAIELVKLFMDQGYKVQIVETDED
jgi:hypothetical protein